MKTDFQMFMRSWVSKWINFDILENQQERLERKIEVLRYCSKIALESIKKVKTHLEIGMTENQIRNIIKDHFTEHNLRIKPAGLAFILLVSTGPNTAKIHALPSNRKLNANEPIMIDVGTKNRLLADYTSDITRSFYYGEPTKEWIKVWNIVKKAQNSAIGLIRPGRKARHIDMMARKIIRDELNGYNIPHGVGHAVKRMQHATPQMRWTSTDVLHEGDIITVEPGWYGGKIDGKKCNFGIRIEDLLLVTHDGYEYLTKPSNIEEWI
ncbi:MAG: M24 family metallopeptidase [Promethearchaeota archaeon]